MIKTCLAFIFACITERNFDAFYKIKMNSIAINSKKIFKNLLLQNQKVYDFETRHEALRNRDLQNLYKS